MSKSPVTRERIEQEVRQALAATLRKDAATIDLDKPIVKALGATSIDFLDINFRLESTFGVQLATQLLLDHVEEELGEGVAIDRDGRITEPAAELLRMYLGEQPGLKGGLDADEVPSFVTPKVLVQSVGGILEHLPEACGACGSTDGWKTDDGCKVLCAACGAAATYPDGDELTKTWIHNVQAEQGLFPVS
ncbi:MAG: acyl carrier protein [Planctomycetota bacterium]